MRISDWSSDVCSSGLAGAGSMVVVVSDGRPHEQTAGEDFVAVSDRSVTDVYSYLYSRLRDRALAADLPQDVFLAGARARKIVVKAQSVSFRVDLRCSRILIKKTITDMYR